MITQFEKIKKQEEFLDRAEVFIKYYDKFPGRIKFNVEYITDFHNQFLDKTKSVTAVTVCSNRVQELEKRFLDLLNSYQTN